MATSAAIKLPEQLTLANIESVYNELDSALEQGSEICLDAQTLSRIDTSGLQLLCCLQAELQQHDTKIVWQQSSEELVQAANNLGVNQFLAIPTEK